MLPEVFNSDTCHVTEDKGLDKDAGLFDLRDPLLQFIKCDQINFAQDDEWLNIAFVRHDKVPIEPPYIEIVMTGLHNESKVNVCRDHLEINISPCALAP